MDTLENNMLIRCPECHFERTIDTDAIPATATVATCPKCGNRFRFRDPQTGRPVADQPEDGRKSSVGASSAPDSSTAEAPAARAAERAVPPAPHLPTEREGDDPLPPGAVIPKLDDMPDESPAGRFPGNEEQAGPARSATPPPAAKRSWFGWKKKAHADSSSTPGDSDRELPPRAPRTGKEETDADDRDTGLSRVSGEESGADGVPWEQPERYGFFPSFYHTILRVMFRAPDFFRTIRSDAPLTRPVFFYVLLSFFQTVITRLWSLNSLQELSRTVTDPQTLARIDVLMQGLSTPLILVLTPFLMILQLFLFAAFYHLMIRLAQPDRADFNTVVRVIAYSAAPLVVCVVPLVGNTVGSMWFLASTFVGCKYALDLSWPKTALALVPLFLLALAVMLAILQASLMTAMS